MNPLSSSGASRSPHPAFSVVWTPLGAVVPSGVQTTAARAATAPAAELTATRRGVARQTLRFAAIELGIWALLYAVYLAVRGIAIADEGAAFANASLLIDLEKAGGLFHEAWLQKAVGTSETFFSAYYMLGFGPLVIGTLIWLGLRRPGVYHQLRTVLIVSIALASLVYVLVPTAPPRLVEGLGIADTVGLSSHDTGSFAGIRFNPYAAMPSMHVGWSVLVAIYGFRAARRRPVRALFALHPLLMALAVTATGNHFFVDSLAGAGIAGATLLTIHLSRRWVAPAWQHRTPRHASAS